MAKGPAASAGGPVTSCLVLGEHHHAPPDRSLTRLVPMVVLRREGLPFITRHLKPATTAPVDPRIRRFDARLVDPVELGVVVLSQSFSVFIERHVGGPFMFEGKNRLDAESQITEGYVLQALLLTTPHLGDSSR
jgi:hypothetical protein